MKDNYESSKQDKKTDKKLRIKEGSKRDQAMDTLARKKPIVKRIKKGKY